MIPEKEDNCNRKEFEKMREELKMLSLCIEKYHNFFEEGKNVFLSLTM